MARESQARTRAVDAAISANLKATGEYQKVSLRTKWENDLTDKWEEKQKTQRVAQLRRSSAEDLLMRKKQLAELLNSEMSQWEKEFSSEKETPADRKLSLQTRALALRDENERERRAFCDKMYRLQWQTSCDDGRLLDSKATVQRVMEDRAEQLRQKEEIRQKLLLEEEMLSREWQQRIDELEARENEKESARRRQEMEIKGMLDTQVASHAVRKEALRARVAAEATEELTALKAAKDKDRAKEHAKISLERSMGTETREFNQSRLHLRGEAAERVRGEDLLLLNFALDKERAEAAAEHAKKHAEHETTKRYQEYLKAQRVREAQNTAAVDAVRKAQEDAVFEAREKEQQDRLDARNSLWAKTDAGRREQIRMRAEREAKAQEEDAVEVAKIGRNQAELDRIEAEKVAAFKKAVVDNHSGILAQVGHRNRLKKKEEQGKFLESKIMLKAESEHRQRLTELAGEVKVYFPNKHIQWYS